MYACFVSFSTKKGDYLPSFLLLAIGKDITPNPIPAL